MPTSDVQSRDRRSLLPLKPIQPTHLWTFDNALSLLKSCQDPYIQDALDEFLLLNSSLFLNASPFSPSQTSDIAYTKEFTLRSILYSDITTQIFDDSKKISKLLNLDVKETIRIVSQTSTKIHQKNDYDYRSIKSKLPDDREKYLEEERILLYSSKILRERRIIFKLVTELLNNKQNDAASSTIQNLGKQIYLSETYIIELISSLETILDSIIAKSYLSEYSEKLDDLSYNETILMVIETIKVLVELVIQNPNISQNMIKKWFSVMKKYNFMFDLGPYIKYHETFESIRGLATIVTILFLDIENCHKTDDLNHYFNNKELFGYINETITDISNTNSIVLYSWSIIILKKYYILEGSNVTIDQFGIHDFGALIQNINEKCLSLNVYEELYFLNDLMKFDNIYSAILSSVIITAMPLITLTSEIATTISSILKNAPNSVVEKFFDDDSTKGIIAISRAKFPIQIIPYLKLASINGNFAFHEFTELKSYMAVFKKEEFHSLYTIDDGNTELIKLTDSVSVLPPYEVDGKLSLLLQLNTKGKILPSANSDETLVTFLHNSNGWALLGRILENISKLFDNTYSEKTEFVVNHLNLVSKVVEDNSQESANQVLEFMSAYIDDSDILEVILRLFEQSLHSRSIDILESIINLLAKLMPFVSYKIWPYLAKSSLLSSSGKEGIASTIFGAIEMVNGDYKITVALIKLVDSLVQNCLSLNEDYPEHSKSETLSRFITHLIYVFESFVYCSFKKSSQKMEIGVLILDVFSNVLSAIYGIDEGVELSKKVTKVFAPLATKIIDSFLITGDSYPRTLYPILDMIDSASSSLNYYELSDLSEFWYQNWISYAFSFSQLIISIRGSLKQPTSAFESCLFKRLPALVTMYSQYDVLRKVIIDLFTSLTNAQRIDELPPSLLSHLGRDFAQILLRSLVSDLDNSFNDYKLKVSLYDFICAVLSGKQDGLAVLFMSGRDVFGDLTKSNEKESEVVKPISLLNVLKKNVREIKYYPTSVSIHLIDAISLAFNTWNTARENSADIGFVKELISAIKLSGHTTKSSDEYISACYELKLMSKITETLSLILFTSRDDLCKKEIINFINSDEFIDLAKSNFAISDYKPSLHLNLHSSFETYFPDISLNLFSSALLKRNRFGVSAVYNLALMDRLLEHSSEWPQLRERVIASSINLQYLNSQIAVAKSFGALLSAYCKRGATNLDTKFLMFITHLLKTSVNEGIPADIFKELFEEREELAFYLLYSLSNNSKLENCNKTVLEIIKAASDLIFSPTVNFTEALTKGTGNYRPILRILYCAINLIKDDTAILVEYFSIFRDLFDLIITKGIKHLLIELQNDVYLSQTTKNHTSIKMSEKIDDLMLILSILKLFVRVKSSPSLHYEMASLLNNSGTIRSLLNLYSFSHLIEFNDEHIFSQLSLMFIQELMTNQSIAEKLVESGLFMVLVESSISEPIKKGNLNAMNSLYYHAIWTNGILPIFLISVSKLGPSVVPEICFALQHFGKQIESCIESWSKDSSSLRITSSTISETSQILILYLILQSLNAGEYLRSISPSVTDDVDISVLPGLETEAKRDDFVDCLNNLLKHPKFLSSRIMPSSLEEKRILDNEDALKATFIKGLIDEIRELKDSLA